MREYCAQMERFVRLHGNDMARLRRHLLAGERELACGLVSNVKDIAQLIGARRIAQLANELTRALRKGSDEDAIVALAGACELEFKRLAEVIRPTTPPQSVESSLS